MAQGLNNLGQGLARGFQELHKEKQNIDQFEAGMQMLGQTPGPDGKPLFDPKSLANGMNFTRQQKAAVGGQFLGMVHSLRLIQDSARQAAQDQQLFPLQKRALEARVSGSEQEAELFPTKRRQVTAEADLAEAKALQAAEEATLPYLRVGQTVYDKKTGQPIQKPPTASQIGTAENRKATLMGREIADLDSQFKQSAISPGSFLDPNAIEYQKIENDKGIVVKDPSQATHVKVPQYLTNRNTGETTEVEGGRILSKADFNKIQAQAQRLESLRAVRGGWSSDPIQNTWREWAVGQLQKLGKPLSEDMIQKAISLGVSKSGGKIPVRSTSYGGVGGSASIAGEDEENGDYATQEEDEEAESDL